MTARTEHTTIHSLEIKSSFAKHLSGISDGIPTKTIQDQNNKRE
jgi:hypothetical protein